MIAPPDFSGRTLCLRRSQLLAYGAALELECRGYELGWASISRLLNRLTGRHWSAGSWLALLAEPYQTITGPLGPHDHPSTPQKP